MSLLMIAAGAILAIAVDWSVSGVDIKAIGAILIVVGAIGMLVSLLVVTGLFAAHEPHGDEWDHRHGRHV